MGIKRDAGLIFDPISGAVIGWYERRGDKVIEIFNEDNGSPERLGREETRLVEGARLELQAAHYPTDIEIKEAANKTGEDIKSALMAATDNVAKAEGHTSRLWLAMRYLAQRSLLQVYVVNDRDKGAEAVAQAALCGGVVFAFAFLEWHQTFHGTNDAAYNGRRVERGAHKGKAAKTAKKRVRYDAVARAVGPEIYDKTVSYSHIATFRRASINQALAAAGDRQYPDSPKGKEALAALLKRIRECPDRQTPRLSGA
jgi:hypothetical protein